MSDENLISKTRRKRQMHDLQSVGEALTRLSAERLAAIELPDDLREAVQACQRITKHEAKRRQMQYIGRLMRDIDAGPIVAQLQAQEAPSHEETALFHRVERWRDELLADPAAVERFARDHPGADPHRLANLARAAREERQGGGPPRRARELFQAVNEIVREHERRHA